MINSPELTSFAAANMTFMTWDRVVSLYGETTLLFRKAVVNNFLDTAEDHQTRWNMAGEGWNILGDVNLLYARQGDECIDLEPGVRSVSDNLCTTIFLGGTDPAEDMKWREQTWRFQYCHHKKSVHFLFRCESLVPRYGVTVDGVERAEEVEVERQLRIEAVSHVSVTH